MWRVDTCIWFLFFYIEEVDWLIIVCFLFFACLLAQKHDFFSLPDFLNDEIVYIYYSRLNGVQTTTTCPLIDRNACNHHTNIHTIFEEKKRNIYRMNCSYIELTWRFWVCVLLAFSLSLSLSIHKWESHMHNTTHLHTSYMTIRTTEFCLFNFYDDSGGSSGMVVMVWAS